MQGCGPDARAASKPDVASAAEKGAHVAAERAALDIPPRPVVADQARLHPGFDPNSACTCDTDKYYNGWCWHCNVGYVAGHKVESSMLFMILDPHGHDLDNQLIKDQLCPDALPADDWCVNAAMGFVAGKTYFTRLTWGLAKGTPANVALLPCAMCRSHGGDEPGWCDHCQRGIVGNVVFTDRALFETTAAEYRNLLAAIEREKVCQTCACVMVVHRKCMKCNISYELPPSTSTAAAQTVSPTQSSRDQTSAGR
jgi:hypothetical protein